MDKYQAPGALYQMSETYLLAVLTIVSAAFIGILLFAPAKRTVEWKFEPKIIQKEIPELQGAIGCPKS